VTFVAASVKFSASQMSHGLIAPLAMKSELLADIQAEDLRLQKAVQDAARENAIDLERRVRGLMTEAKKKYDEIFAKHTKKPNETMD
jgi:hypothetical protein